jgi:hypothetical protein
MTQATWEMERLGKVSFERLDSRNQYVFAPPCDHAVLHEVHMSLWVEMKPKQHGAMEMFRSCIVSVSLYYLPINHSAIKYS